MNPGDTNSESVAGSLISNGETLQLSGVRVRGLTNVHIKDRKVWVLPEGGGGRSLGTCVLCSLQPRDSVASPCSCRPVPGSGSCDTGDRPPPGAPSFSGHVKSLSGWLCLPDSPLPALMSRCLPVPSSCGWNKTWPPAPTITPLVTSGPDSWLISLPYLVPLGPDPARSDP